MPDDDKTDLEKIKTLKASVAVKILGEIDAMLKAHHGNVSAAVILDLANAYKIAVENAPRPAQRPAQIG